MAGEQRQVWFMCGWQVKLGDPLVTHGPYLSTLEIRHNKVLYKSILFPFFTLNIFVTLMPVTGVKPALCKLQCLIHVQ